MLVVGTVLGLRLWMSRLRGRLARLAERRGGRLVADGAFVIPRVEWSLGDGLLQATVHQEASLPDGREGLCSAVHVTGARIPRFELELRRAERLRGEWQVPPTRDAAFAQAFRLRTDDEAHASALLDAELRRAVLAFDPALDICLRRGTVSAYRDGVRRRDLSEPRLELSLRGVPADTALLERLVTLARSVYERCEARRAA